MNDETIHDLKQFIAANVHQEFSGLKVDMSELKADIAKLDKKIDDRTDEIISAIGDTTSDRFDSVEDDIKNLDTRVIKLESKPA